MSINDEFDLLAKYENICFENEDSFLLRFGQGDIWQLASVSFSSEIIRFVYVLHSGAHISNSCERNEFIKWYKEITNEN
jgi:hypothetical protein